MYLGKYGRIAFMVHMVIVFTIMLLAINKLSSPLESEVYKCDVSRDISFVYMSEVLNVPEVVPEPEVLEIQQPQLYFDWSDNDKYMLAKIAMCEAEGESIETKMLVIATIINRVESNKFPDSISEVIFENNGQCYQFSPVMPDGSWWYKEPNEECYKAVELVAQEGLEYSSGCLYFESCEEADNWHSRNLKYLFQSDDLRFYK